MLISDNNTRVREEKMTLSISRRRFLKCTSAATLTSGTALATPTLAQNNLPDPGSVLADISIGKYVRP
ncbi:MAG: twin-arginine translocation signal domain-containing protein, partial [Pseudomonadota bacterium]